MTLTVTGSNQPQQSSCPGGGASPGPGVIYNDGIQRQTCYNLDSGGDVHNFAQNSCMVVSGLPSVPVPHITVTILSWDTTLSMTVGITADTQAVPGTYDMNCKYDGVAKPIKAGQIQVADSTPVITSVNELQIAYPGGQSYIQILGQYFGNAGSVTICMPNLMTSSPCSPSGITTTTDPGLAASALWSPNQVNALLTVPQGTAPGVYDVRVNVGVDTAGAMFAPGPGGSSTALFQGGVTVVEIQMKLEMKNPQNPTVISTDGKYSENTTVLVTAVRADTAAPVPNFVGTVNIDEDTSATNYSRAYGNTDDGADLPSTVSISSGGMATFVAKSLALPAGIAQLGKKPNDAMIITTNYPVYVGTGALLIPQWIVFDPKPGPDTPGSIDPKSRNGVYDWVQAMTKDIFASGASDPDVATVLGSVSSYIIKAMSGVGHTSTQHGLPQSQIEINPYSDAMRTNTDGGSVCGQPRLKFLTATFLHEARHAYQGTQAAIPGNDQDLDFLVTNRVDVAPNDIIVDSTVVRDVCNDSTALIERKAYRGPTIPDMFEDPDWARYAFELDARMFSASHVH